MIRGFGQKSEEHTMLGMAAQSSDFISSLWWIAPLASLAALVTAWFLFRWMKGQDPGTQRMQEIAGYVREGAYAYLYAQYRVVG
jgi:K(+)-stimulated pyrophosphate-energized sodium pump